MAVRKGGRAERGGGGECRLALADGTVFVGQSVGAPGTVVGEVIFNTGMCGYQEILTDPSYCGQIVVMTSPQIGNYGVNEEDVEADRPWVEGFVMRELSPRVSNWRATGALGAYLAEHGIVAMSGVDTRAITRRIRLAGAMPAVMSTEIADEAELASRAASAAGMSGQNLVSRVTCREVAEYAPEGEARYRVVVIDCGMKRNIVRCLVARGCRVTVVPAGTSAGAVLGYGPDGVVVSNGPGDPEPVRETVAVLERLIGQVPLMGICLGHQLLALALGGRTYKLPFGHHGVNHPVLNVATGRVEITSQNHGFAVDTDSVRRLGLEVTHVNLNDGTLEGFAHTVEPVLAVQYHPEAAPGPHDAQYLFDCFLRMMETGRAPTGAEMAQAQREASARSAEALN